MIAQRVRAALPIDAIRARAYTIPTEDACESDGTLEWDSTTLVYVEIDAGVETGMGYTYGDAGIAALVNGLLAETLRHKDALETGARYAEMCSKVRNNGRGGLTAMAISAVDIALWDLKAKTLGMPLSTLLGASRARVPVYGSGGFTSYGVRELAEHMERWRRDFGCACVKMKIGREPAFDPQRVAAVRKVVGADCGLFVDANGAFHASEALRAAEMLAEYCVTWFEEPVYHLDLRANAVVRERAPAGMEVANGEYGYAPNDFEDILDAGAADVLQADVTRCGGVTGFLAVDALCEARNVPLSTHCAPYATLHAATAARSLRHAEYFFDHVRIERMLFDGAIAAADGAIEPDLSRPGIGLELRRADAERFAA